MHRPHKNLPKPLKEKIDLPFDYKAKHYLLEKVPYAKYVQYLFVYVKNRLPEILPHIFVFLMPPAALIAFIYYFNPTAPIPPTLEMAQLTQLHNLYALLFGCTLYSFNNIRHRIRIPWRKHF